ncbi:uncharacterized protein LOC115973357 isoform X2 [Quercus lobata]|uniref:Myb-like domain-containing protein n=1 Tax=Quercus lobata TaxID=97700 RepID=A0A7N2N8N0_QUELO|nr:uncharacterized protein LOC115973357 isoform X1 [Quercus lobata]XP_030949476.1 uncharacterized protein LOC115973357 isoform X2 [Quercus lobata]
MRSKSGRGGRPKHNRSTSSSPSITATTTSLPMLFNRKHNQFTLDEDSVCGEMLNAQLHNDVAPDLVDHALASKTRVHCSTSHDISTLDDGMEIDCFKQTCIICNQGGHVFVCAESGCPIALHKKCVSQELISDDDLEQFYCPYCLHKRALVQKEQLRKKAELAKEDLLKFLGTNAVGGDGLKQKDGEEKRCQDQHNTDEEQMTEDGALDASKGSQGGLKIHEENISEAHQSKFAEDVENIQLEMNADGALDRSKGGSKDGLKVPEENKGRSKDEEQMQPKSPKQTSNADFASRTTDSDMEILAARVCRIKQRAQKKPFPQNDDSPRKLSSQENSTTEKKVTSKNKKHAASKKSRQPQVSTKQLTTMPFPTAKRKRLLWTAEEENMLKEGVHHVSASAKKNVPWRKILELGRHIFHKSRTPEDLKDKWRTMLAKEP